jgi:hypothetical protein
MADLKKRVYSRWQMLGLLAKLRKLLAAVHFYGASLERNIRDSLWSL